MDDDATPGSPRSVKFALAASLAVGATLVGVGVGGFVGVDRQLEAATPKQGETRVVGDDCPRDEQRHSKQSRRL